MENKKLKIAAIVVTHNRLSKLKKCIGFIKDQKLPPDMLIVVNNGSNDGTSDYLSTVEGVTVIEQENRGCAGGFKSGILRAIEEGADLFWLMDDDCYPRTDALKMLVNGFISLGQKPGFLASLVLDRNNTPVPMDFVRSKDWQEYQNIYEMGGCHPVHYASFVSILVSYDAVKTCGLPLEGFFIWVDDVEFTTRIGSVYPGYSALDSIVIHDGISIQESPKSELSELKKYCFYRNMTAYMIFMGGGLLRTGFRISRFFAQSILHPKYDYPLFLICRAILSGIHFAMYNRSFIRPLSGTPVETTPAIMPRTDKT